MKLTVFVHDQPVATLDSPDGFKHVLTYHPDTPSEFFASLLMPVRTESYVYPELHPLFRMNLPEGFLLGILQEQLGPLLGASPLELLAVVGRNSIGRVKVAPVGSGPQPSPMPFEIKDLLKGDNSEEAFVKLVRRFATSGVSGVVPKFLAPNAFGESLKGTLTTDRYIIKGTTSRLPGIALNEHFCMKVSDRAFGHAAKTEVSEDGQALVVHRFDYVGESDTRLGMEDMCSLLLLRPEEKYGSTWEKVVNRIKNVTKPHDQPKALSDLGNLLLLTYALRNADCHTKNIALLYSDKNHVSLAPVYDMLTISVYDDYCNNPPGMPINGRSTWTPGKSLENFLLSFCGISAAETHQRIERVCEAIVDVSPEVIHATREYPSFHLIGPRMLHMWNEGMNSLRLKRTWVLPSLMPSIEKEGWAGIAKPKAPPKSKTGKSQLSPM